MAEAPLRGAPRLTWSVSALLQAVGDALASRWSVCSVQGEIAGWSRAASGHAYFNLKDADHGAALLRCAMFRRAGSWLDFDPADGQRVEVRGRLAVYEPRGELQLVVESMRRAGDGSLYEQFLRLKAKLEAEGLFDVSRKRPLPRHPRTLGVVTSADAAALRDVAAVLARRSPQIRLVVYPAVVQGPAAPAALVAALAAAARRAEADLLLVVRGGGSIEDLWAFNHESVVRAIAALPMPSICGIGHETDVTLADFAADLRAATPTAAAELAAATRQSSIDTLEGLRERARRTVSARLDGLHQRLDRAALRLARPASTALRHRDRLDHLALRLRAASWQVVARRRSALEPAGSRPRVAAARRLATQAERLDAIGARLAALDPRRVLARGYAWLADARGEPVMSVRRLGIGEIVAATLADGQAALLVQQVQPRPGDD